MDDVSEELTIYIWKIKAPPQTFKIVIFKWMRPGRGRVGRSTGTHKRSLEEEIKLITGNEI